MAGKWPLVPVVGASMPTNRLGAGGAPRSTTSIQDRFLRCAAPRCAALRPWTHWPHHTTPQFSLNKKFPLFQKDWRVKPVTSTHTYYSQNVLLRITCTQSTRTARTLPAESRPISRRFSFREHGQLNENIAGASTGEMQTSLFFSFFCFGKKRGECKSRKQAPAA